MVKSSKYLQTSTGELYTEVGLEENTLIEFIFNSNKSYKHINSIKGKLKIHIDIKKAMLTVETSTFAQPAVNIEIPFKNLINYQMFPPPQAKYKGYILSKKSVEGWKKAFMDLHFKKSNHPMLL